MALAAPHGGQSRPVCSRSTAENSRCNFWLASPQNEYAGGVKCSKKVHLTTDTDLSKMRVAQMREVLRDRGIVCRECVEKQDYIALLRKLVQDS